jgi:hypothetical protein
LRHFTSTSSVIIPALHVCGLVGYVKMGLVIVLCNWGSALVINFIKMSPKSEFRVS